jgi:D-aminopeptidase
MSHDSTWRPLRDTPRAGRLPSAPRDTIADVDGVTVGHATLATGDLQTGVTVVRPHAGDPFRQKVPAAAVVINGFAKAVGLSQVNELGVLETPIALTNTFSVNTVATAQIRAAIAAHPDIARRTTSVNPLVLECSDAYLSDMQALAVTEAHYREALDAASVNVARGSVGAGRGMSCFELKGGIGTASRMAYIAPHAYTLGVLVLANFGIGRAGSYYGHGSGDIALAFSTAATVEHAPTEPIASRDTLAEALLESLFEACAEATEQAILDALFQAETVRGFRGHVRYALHDIAPDWRALGA